MVNINGLKKLVLERPDLEITPMVSEDAASPDYAYTMASVGKCSIEKIAMSSINDEKVLTYRTDEDDFVDDYLYQNYGEDSGLTEDELIQKAKDEYENLPWEETILIYIESF